MRGERGKQGGMLCLISPPDQVIPAGHPLHRIKKLVEAALKSLSPVFDQMYNQVGRPSSVDFRGDKRGDRTHQSTTDLGARLMRKSGGDKARLSYSRNALMENRNGLLKYHLMHQIGLRHTHCII